MDEQGDLEDWKCISELVRDQDDEWERFLAASPPWILKQHLITNLKRYLLPAFFLRSLEGKPAIETSFLDDFIDKHQFPSREKETVLVCRSGSLERILVSKDSLKGHTNLENMFGISKTLLLKQQILLSLEQLRKILDLTIRLLLFQSKEQGEDLKLCEQFSKLSFEDKSDHQETNNPNQIVFHDPREIRGYEDLGLASQQESYVPVKISQDLIREVAPEMSIREEIPEAKELSVHEQVLSFSIDSNRSKGEIMSSCSGKTLVRVLVLLDLDARMKRYLPSIKKYLPTYLSHLVDSVRFAYPDNSIAMEFALMTYRDSRNILIKEYPDNGENTKPREWEDFQWVSTTFSEWTGDLKAIEKSLLSTKAFGGGDICGEVAESLKEAVRQAFPRRKETNASEISRIILHFTDSPAHGTPIPTDLSEFFKEKHLDSPENEKEKKEWTQWLEQNFDHDKNPHTILQIQLNLLKKRDIKYFFFRLSGVFVDPMLLKMRAQMDNDSFFVVANHDFSSSTSKSPKFSRSSPKSLKKVGFLDKVERKIYHHPDDFQEVIVKKLSFEAEDTKYSQKIVDVHTSVQETNHPDLKVLQKCEQKQNFTSPLDNDKNIHLIKNVQKIVSLSDHEKIQKNKAKKKEKKKRKKDADKLKVDMSIEETQEDSNQRSEKRNYLLESSVNGIRGAPSEEHVSVQIPEERKKGEKTQANLLRGRDPVAVASEDADEPNVDVSIEETQVDSNQRSEQQNYLLESSENGIRGAPTEERLPVQTPEESVKNLAVERPIASEETSRPFRKMSSRKGRRTAEEYDEAPERPSRWFSSLCTVL